jgi:branched-chain amino acid aminotransferase
LANPAYLWWNGKQVRWDDATVHVTSLGWSTVGAIFEGIRAYWNAEEEELYVFRLPEHMQRFERSLRLVRLSDDYGMDTLSSAIVELLRANDEREDTYIRPLGYRGSGGNKRMAGWGGSTEILINTHPNPTHLLSGNGEHAMISSWRRISEEVMPPRVKNLSNYRNSQLGGMEAFNSGYDEAIFLNQQGKVTEGGGACIMLIRDGVLITPDPTQGILESITRDALLQLGRDELGLKVEERAVDRTELYISDEVFMCGTAAEITPIFSVDKYTVGDGGIGPITHKLEGLLDDCFRGKTGIRPEWRTKVGVKSAVPA